MRYSIQRYLPLALVLVLYLGCTPKIYRTEEDGVRPYGNVFYRLSPFDIGDTALLDIHSIYYCPDIAVTKAKKTVINKARYYRFYKDGKVQLVTTEGKDLNSIVNNTQIGLVGYYRFVNEKGKVHRIKLQLLEPQGKHSGQVIYKTGIIRDGDLYVREDLEYPDYWYDRFDVSAVKNIDQKNKYSRTRVEGMREMKLEW